MAGSIEQRSFSELVQRMPGKRITRIDRVWYETGAEIDRGDGPLELHLDDGSVVLLQGAADGESLRVSSAPWKDPFTPPLSDDNKKFVEESGKLTRVEVSGEAPYSDLVGRTVETVEMLENEFGRTAGLAVETNVRTLWFVIQGDEAHVFWAFPLGYRARERFPM